MTRRPLRRGNWSLQELERLRQLLPRSGVVATARLLRRSEDSVERKALDLLRQPTRRGVWSAADDSSLRASWGVVEPRLLGPMLGRTPAEVLARAGELRHRLRSGEWTLEEQQRLKEWYGSRLDADLEVALQRPRAEIAAVADRLCLAKDKRLRAHGVPAGTRVPRHRMPRWTAAEELRLREIYADLDNLAVARLLARTVTSVANKAHQLGLAKSPALLATIGRRNVAIRYQPEPPAPLSEASLGATASPASGVPSSVPASTPSLPPPVRHPVVPHLADPSQDGGRGARPAADAAGG